MESGKTSKRIVYRRPIDGVVSSRYIDRHVYIDRRYKAQRIGERNQSRDAASNEKPIKRYGPLDMSLPGEESVMYRQFRRIDSVWKTVRKWTFRATAATLLLMIAGAGLLFTQGYLKLHQVFRGDNTHVAAALHTHVSLSMLKGEGDGRINILLLGKGGPGHDGPDLTDTILLVSIDPINHKAALVSVPRDIWVKIPGYGDMKINAAYANAKYHLQAQGKSDDVANAAGIELIEKQVHKVLGMNINYYAMVDFTAFQQAINTVGGIDVNVPQTLYDPTMAWQNGWSPIIAKKGLDHMDGYHALLYARSRETTSDFARTERQRQIITVLEQKMFALGTFANPIKDTQLMSAFGNHAQTDLSIKNAMRLYNIMQKIKVKNIRSIGLTQKGHDFLTTGMIGNQSTDYPKAGLFNYSAIHKYIRSALPDGYIVKEHAKIDLVYKAGASSYAKKEAELLKSYGYNVVGVSSSPAVRGTSGVELVDLTHGVKKYTRHYLENRFDLIASTRLPSGVNAPPGTDFVIIVSK